MLLPNDATREKTFLDQELCLYGREDDFIPLNTTSVSPLPHPYTVSEERTLISLGRCVSGHGHHVKGWEYGCALSSLSSSLQLK